MRGTESSSCFLSSDNTCMIRHGVQCAGVVQMSLRRYLWNIVKDSKAKTRVRRYGWHNRFIRQARFQLTKSSAQVMMDCNRRRVLRVRGLPVGRSRASEFRPSRKRLPTELNLTAMRGRRYRSPADIRFSCVPRCMNYRLEAYHGSVPLSVSGSEHTSAEPAILILDPVSTPTHDHASSRD